MNMAAMRQHFDEMVKTWRLEEMIELRDRWINDGWGRISELFVIPSLMKSTTLNTVADQNAYLFPLDYNGTEAYIHYDSRRLDPYPESSLELGYERRTGTRGTVRFYAWSGVAESDLLQVDDCVLTNNSAVVGTVSTDTTLDVGHWTRFDPIANADETYTNPGDYAYQILAGDQVAGTSFTLTRPYRGPTGTFVSRVRPAEQQQFVLYGTPATSEADAILIKYNSRPRRLFNDSDVPEWPDMGYAIVAMAISIGLEFHRQMDVAKTWWGRSMQRAGTLQRRKDSTKQLVSSLAVGNIVGRKVGMRGVHVRHGYSLGR